MPTSQPDDSALLKALEECAREPIHTPGSVQECGAILALDDDGAITQCGGGVEGAVGASADALLGRPLSQVFLSEDAAGILTAFADLTPDVVRRVGYVYALAGTSKPLEASVHIRDGVRLLEVIVADPIAPGLLGRSESIVDAVDDLTARLARDEPFLSFAQAVTERLRLLTGYDRVMVYHFDPDWNGEVVAESRQAESAPYLGLWYPASDIPPQARALYLVNRVRVFADTSADPLPLHPRINPTTGRELDLSLATLRALSPVHREYLRNMGVGATLVASVVINGRLWGLIACHHHQRRMPPALAVRLIVSVERLLSLRVSLGEQRDRAAGVLTAQALLMRLPKALDATEEVEAALVSPLTGLLELPAADGIAVVYRGRTLGRGTTPSEADILRLAEWLDRRGDRRFATAALGNDAPEFAGLAVTASGLLAARFPNTTPIWVLWFRGEVTGSVKWAGDPRKGLTTDDAPRLSPRRSFEAWVEAVRGRSRPWTVSELNLIDEIVRPNITEVLLQASQAARMRAEESLRLMQAVVENSRDGILVTEADNIDLPRPRIVYANPAMLHHTGYAPAELVGQNPRIFQGPSTDRATLDRLRDCIAANEPVMVELLNYAKDGTAYWVELSVAPLLTPSGNVTHYISIQRDISARKLSEQALKESEERFRQAFDYSSIGMALVAPEGQFLRVNSAMQAVFGCSEADLLGTDCVTLTAPDDREADKVWVEAMLAGEIEAHTLEKRYLKGDGRTVWVLLTISLVRDAVGRPVYFVAQFQDVTARRAAEADLRASEGRLRLALEAGHMGTFDWDIGTGRIVWSKSHYELFGYDGSDPFPVEFRHFSDRVHPDDRARVEAKVQAAMVGRNEYMDEWRVLLPDGSVRWVFGHGRFEFGPDGKAVRMLGIAQDVTRRKADEAAVRANEVQYRTLFEMCPDAIYLLDMGGRIRSANPAATTQNGYTPAELQSMRIQDLDTPDQAVKASDRLQRLRAGESLRFEIAHRRKDGTHVELDVRASAVEIGGESLVLAFDRDITAERAAAAALAAANDLYRLLADGMQDVISVHDTSPKARYLYVSPSGERLTGYRADELIGRDYLPEVHPDDLPTLAHANRTNLRGEVTQIEWRSRHKDGHYVWLETVSTPVTDAAGAVTRLICTSRDIGRRKEMEDQLRQAQKLEAIGQLAGGVAHDFNNLLTVVNGCSELLLEDLPAGAGARPLLEDILAAGERGAGLTRQLLAFSRQQMLKAEVFDLSGVVPATAKMVGRLLGEDIVMSLRLNPAAGCVKADLGQVEQIIINLAVNARDAMPTGGTLILETGPAEVREDSRLPSPDARPGRYVRLAVTDTGTGMTPEVQARLFEPFFTTKPTGEGTGLGLATVYGIVRQSGGFLTVESKVGRGTTFAVYLPRNDEVAEGPKSTLRPKSKAGGETVLVVEDDASVRTLTTTILARHGYRVEAAENGAAALAACDRLSAPPDLLLTDVVMPGMSGRELADTLTSRYPRLMVVFLSGYTADHILRHGVEEDRMAFLQKPYTPDSLCRFVRGVLDGTGDG